jgi:hypothetical protein
LTLRLPDFTHEALARSIGNKCRQIRLSSQQLFRFLAEAEEYDKGGSEEHPLPGDVFCKRKAPLPESLRLEDEATYADQEERAQKRMNGQDKLTRRRRLVVDG